VLPIDPYVEAALQAPEQAPPSPDYVPAPEHPPSPDYVPGPEEPEQAPFSLDYVPEPEYPEYLSSDDDDDEQEAFEDDDEEEEEHLAPADSSVIPAIDPVSSVEDTEAFETDESAPTPVPSLRHRTAMMSVRPQIPMSYTTEALIAEYASAPTPPSPPPSPLYPLSSPLLQIPSPPLPLPPPPTTSPTYAEAPLGNRVVEIWLRAV
ncbi:hypothetical protein Tco_0577757, partial [Tanacetum coccineum]